jgi:cupin fold WbuC family metalloprotein
MRGIELIGQELLDNVVESARTSARRRKNYNFHRTDGDASHRLLNAIEPGSYIQPHCHADASKDETIIALRGQLGVVFFEPNGQIGQTVKLVAGGPVLGVNIPYGTFHTLVALETGCVFFESKAGPYMPLRAEEKASWAPGEGEPEAVEYLREWEKLFS